MLIKRRKKGELTLDENCIIVDLIADNSSVRFKSTVENLFRKKKKQKKTATLAEARSAGVEWVFVFKAVSISDIERAKKMVD